MNLIVDGNESDDGATPFDAGEAAREATNDLVTFLKAVLSTDLIEGIEESFSQKIVRERVKVSNEHTRGY